MQYTDSIKKGEDPDVDTVSLDIGRSLTEHARDYLSGGYSDDQYETALFAVAAFIDEKMLSAKWSGKKKWKQDSFQMKYFNTLDAGEIFYDKLSGLSYVNPADRDIREVYYYCLAMGFRGKYFHQEHHARLSQIILENRKLLTGEDEDIERFQEKPLFPDAYLPGQEGTGVIRHRDFRPLIFGIPAIILIVVFFLFKSRIMDAANILVSAV